MIKKYIEEDKIGKHRVIEQGNGIKIRILEKPSEWYKEKQKKNAEVQQKIMAEKQIEKDREKLIREKMRELAETALKEEGKI